MTGSGDDFGGLRDAAAAPVGGPSPASCDGVMWPEFSPPDSLVEPLKFAGVLRERLDLYGLSEDRGVTVFVIPRVNGAPDVAMIVALGDDDIVEFDEKVLRSSYVASVVLGAPSYPSAPISLNGYLYGNLRSIIYVRDRASVVDGVDDGIARRIDMVLAIATLTPCRQFTPFPRHSPVTPLASFGWTVRGGAVQGDLAVVEFVGAESGSPSDPDRFAIDVFADLVEMGREAINKLLPFTAAVEGDPATVEGSRIRASLIVKDPLDEANMDKNQKLSSGLFESAEAEIEVDPKNAALLLRLAKSHPQKVIGIAGKNPKALEVKLRGGQTLLHYLAVSGQVNKREIFDFLISHPKIGKLPDDDGATPLHLLVLNLEGNEGLLKKVLDLPKDQLSHETDDGETPLHYMAHGAQSSGNRSLIDAIAKHPLSKKKGRGGESPSDILYMESSVFYGSAAAKSMLAMEEADRVHPVRDPIRRAEIEKWRGVDGDMRGAVMAIEKALGGEFLGFERNSSVGTTTGLFRSKFDGMITANVMRDLLAVTGFKWISFRGRQQVLVAIEM